MLPLLAVQVGGIDVLLRPTDDRRVSSICRCFIINLLTLTSWVRWARVCVSHYWISAYRSKTPNTQEEATISTASRDHTTDFGWWVFWNYWLCFGIDALGVERWWFVGMRTRWNLEGDLNTHISAFIHRYAQRLPIYKLHDCLPSSVCSDPLAR